MKQPVNLRPVAITIAAGLLATTIGTVGLLTRHPTPAMRPPPAGVATVPVPPGPIVDPSGLLPVSPRLIPLASSVHVARPVSLTIPLIGVQTRLVELGRAAGGALQVPSSTAVAGWYTGSPRPGVIGPAVIAGHIDSLTGPAVLLPAVGTESRRPDLRPANRRDTAEFRVTAVQTYLKSYFPTAAVYGPTPDPELRLITCGGTFDYATGHYLSNTIVYAAETP